MGELRIPFSQLSARMWAMFAALLIFLLAGLSSSTPVGAQSAQNLAPAGSAKQSSLSFGGVPERAIDGNTSGKWADGSITATAPQTDPFWEVNIGASTVNSVVVWNRTDCCAERLKDAWVFVSETPFGSKTLAQIKRDSSIKQKQISGSPTRTTLNFGGVKGNYVRVQLEGNKRLLSLAEVQVFGTGGTTSDEVKLANATQSSTSYEGVAPRAIDGNTNGSWGQNSVTATGTETNPWWQADFGQATVDSVQLSNRTDCCAERLKDAWVFISDTPFGNRSLDELKRDQAVTKKQVSGIPLPNATINFGGVKGRHIRVQLEGSNRLLSLAEVKVFGSGGGPLPEGDQKMTFPGLPTQSSTSFDGVPARATDGNTNGSWGQNSVTATGTETNPWWQTEFRRVNVTRVVLWNRTDCCAERLKDAWVLVSDQPFGTKTLAQLRNDPAVTAKRVSGVPSPSATVDFGGVKARYVRVQLEGSNKILSLAEVELFAEPTITQSSTGTWEGIAGDATRAFDGKVDASWTSGSVSSTAPGDANPWWNIELDTNAGLARIDILNRTDCCRDRLDNLNVKISTTAANACADRSAITYPVDDFDSFYSRRISVSKIGGKYPVPKSVCIQKTKGEILAMAEVQLRFVDPAKVSAIPGPVMLVNEIGHVSQPLSDYYLGYPNWEGAVWNSDGDDIVDSWAGDLGEAEVDDGYNSKKFRGSRSSGSFTPDYCQYERHIYPFAGDDLLNMIFPTYKGSERRRCGHHPSGYLGSDTFNFVDVDNVAAGKVVVGRINDFDPTRDKLQINGADVDVTNPPANVKFVAWNGDMHDLAARPQRPQIWIVIKSALGGHVFYTLEGPRYEYQTDTTKGHQEKHFITNIPRNLDALPAIPFEDVVSAVPYGEYRNLSANAMRELYRFSTEGVQGEMHQWVTTGSDSTTRIDVIHGAASQDYVFAGAGDDLIAGAASYDFLHGQDGNDKIWGGTGDDKTFGGAGNDTIEGNWGNDFLVGGLGSDKISGNDGDDTIFADNLIGDGFESDYWNVTGAYAVNTNMTSAEGVTVGRGKSFDPGKIRTHQFTIADDDGSLASTDTKGQITQSALGGSKHPETGVPAESTAVHKGYYEVRTSRGATGKMLLIEVKSNYSSSVATPPAPVEVLVPISGFRPTAGDAITFTSNLIPDEPTTTTTVIGSQAVTGQRNYREFAQLVESPRTQGTAGDDVLSGGAGKDTFVIAAVSGNDVIEDFVPGEDTLIFVGVSSFTGIRDSGQDVIIATERGSVRLKGLAGRDLGRKDFVFQREPPT